MADDKDGREAQARTEDRRQRERDLAEAVERADEPEPEPAVDPETVTAALDDEGFPATAAAVVAAVGDRRVAVEGSTRAVADLLPDTETETFERPAAVRERVGEPPVAVALKRVVEAAAGLPDAGPWGSQREAYLRTFRAVRELDESHQETALDDVTDWAVGRIEEKGSLPGSRSLRREAGKRVRANGHAVRNDEWLGV